MSEETTVTNKHVGYSFSLSVETETRIETGMKYPDKQVVSARLGGHTETFEDAVAQLKKARKEIAEVLADEKKTKGTS